MVTAKAREAESRPARTAQALEFLQLLWGPNPPAGFLVTWSKDLGPRSSSDSYPATDLARAAAAAVNEADLPTGPGIPDYDWSLGREVYFGTCLQAEEPEGWRRGTASGACAIPGLWADLDVAGPAHKSASLPPTKEAAADLARRAPWPPSVLVDSGNGLQAWWLFPEPLLLKTDDDRKRAADLVARLQDCLRQNPEGWDVDPTADLARVLRLPGTWNRKLQHRAERLERKLSDARHAAKYRSENPCPPPRDPKCDRTPAEWRAEAEKAAREAEDLARELETLEAAGTAPALVRVLEMNEERHSPEEWDAALPSVRPRPGPVAAPAPPSGNGKRPSSPGRPSVEERAARYLETLGPAVQGQGGDAHSCRAAWAVAVEFGLPEPAARRVLWEWDRSNVPPWQDTEPEGLEGKLRSALAKAPGHAEFGRLAEEDRPAPGGAKVVPIRPGGRQKTNAPASSGAVALDRDDDEEDSRKITQAMRLLELAAPPAVKLFRTPSGEAHATLQARGRQETWPVRGKLFSAWLRNRFETIEDRPPGSDAIRTAVDTLEARALLAAGPEAVREVYIRSAGAEGKVWLDLADQEGRAVAVGPDGWTVTRTPPVAFRRTQDAKPLPVPLREGSWEPLRDLVNLSDEGFILFVGWLVAALGPLAGYPVLIAEGVQGSAKSSLARTARALIDPAGLDVQRPPDQERDLFIRAGNCRLLALDNLTRPPRWLSDTLCVIASGGGYATRELHTDKEETIFRACLPIVITGIEGLAQGDDLADRSIVLTLEAIPPERRRREDEWRAALEEARPRILGALCNALAGALAYRDRVKPPGGLPRMADFAAFVLAAEAAGAMPWEPGRFLEALTANRGAAAVIGLERDMVASTIAGFVAECGSWTGTASQLLASLEARLPEGARRAKAWPKAAHVLSGMLPRREPLLREAGVLIEKTRGTDRSRARLLTLRLAPEPAEEPAPERERGTL